LKLLLAAHRRDGVLRERPRGRHGRTRGQSENGDNDYDESIPD